MAWPPKGYVVVGRNGRGAAAYLVGMARTILETEGLIARARERWKDAPLAPGYPQFAVLEFQCIAESMGLE